MQGVFLKCYPVYISDFENAIFQFWLMAKGELFPVLFVAAGYLYAALPPQPEPLNLTKKAALPVTAYPQPHNWYRRLQTAKLIIGIIIIFKKAN